MFLITKMRLSQNKDKPLFHCLNAENIFNFIQKVPHELKSSS